MSYTLRGRIESRLAAAAIPFLVACVVALVLHAWWPVELFGAMLGAALALGGNVRTGLEDNLYLPSGEMAKSNGELIAKARQMAEDVGRHAATVAEARELLGVPARADERASA